MKKTIIALLALAGVAAAADLSLTTGISYTKNKVTTLVDGFTNPENEDIGYSTALWPGSRNMSELTFDITLSDLYGADAINVSDIVSLTSVQIKVNASGWCMDEGRTITLSTGNLTYSTLINKAGVYSTGSDTITLKPTGWDNLSKDTVLTVSILPAEGLTTTNLSVASADIYGKNGATVAWSGVSNIDMSDNWGNEAPLVKVNIATAPIPEPTTATLSLLALAGLAARRRRASR